MANRTINMEVTKQIGILSKPGYEIAYGALVPKKEECQNLVVPVCASASHIAFGSIRMEPVFMILGQSAGTGGGLTSFTESLPVAESIFTRQNFMTVRFIGMANKFILILPGILPGILPMHLLIIP